MAAYQKIMLGLCLIYLLGSQEALAARTNVQAAAAIRKALEAGAGGASSRAGSRSGSSASGGASRSGSRASGRASGGAHGGGGGGAHEPDELGRLEQLVERLASKLHMGDAASRASGLESLMEMYSQLNGTALQSAQLSQEDVADVEGAVKHLRTLTAKTENLNLFLCKRTPVTEYKDTSMLGWWIFQSRELGEDASFSIKCSNKVNLLDHGKVGDSVTGKSRRSMAKSINSLKALTQDENDDKFPIQLKVCTKPGGCQQTGGSRDANGFAQNSEDLLGGQNASSNQIPVDPELKEFLGKASHNEDHLYAVCYDDQDDCSAMMWVPKNLHSCSGWFTPEDTRTTLSQLGDAVDAGIWGRYWTPSGKDRLVKSLGSRISEVEDEAGEDVELLDEMKTEEQSTGCPLKEFTAKQTREGAEEAQETFEKLREAQQTGQWSAEARAICLDAEQNGEGLDCKRRDRGCLNLNQQCKLVLGRGMHMQCPSEDDMAQLARGGGGSSAGLVEVGSRARAGVRSRGSSGEFAFRRRRRTGSAIADFLFPPYYYGYSPYCYSWYPGYGGFYAYPVVPNVGGFHFGWGTGSPGLMLLEGMGHAVVAMGEGLTYVGASFGNAMGGGFGGGCQGDDCWILLVIIIIFIVIVLCILLYQHCSGEDNCHSWWYRGGRLRTKARKWVGLWEGIEKEVYDDMGATLFFDARMPLGENSCAKELQWGRQWVRKADTQWQNSSMADTDLNAMD